MNKNNLRIKLNPKKPQHAVNNKPNRGQLTFKRFLDKATEIISSRSHNALHKLQHKLKDTPSTFVLPEQLKRQHSHRLQIQKQMHTKSVTKYSNQSKQKSSNPLNQHDEHKLRLLMIRKNQLMQKLRKIDYNLMNPRAQNYRQAHLLTNQSKVTEHSRFNYQRQRGDNSTVKVRQQQTYDVDKHQKTMQMLTRLNNQKIKRQEKIISTMKIKQMTQIKKIEDMQRNKSQLSLSRNNGNQVNNMVSSKLKINSHQERESEPSSNSFKGKLPQFDEISEIQAQNLNEFEQLEPLPVSHIQKQTITQSQNAEQDIVDEQLE